MTSVRVATRLSEFDNFLTEIEGIDIHFIHKRSRHTSATPLLITHGWPGSVLEYLDVIEALTNPTAILEVPLTMPFMLCCPPYRASASRANPIDRELTLPSLPTCGNNSCSASTIRRFMHTAVTGALLLPQAVLLQETTGCLSGHCTLPIVMPDETTLDNLQAEEVDALESFQFYNEWDSGYSKIQSTRPQTLGYSLADSPRGPNGLDYRKNSRSGWTARPTECDTLKTFCQKTRCWTTSCCTGRPIQRHHRRASIGRVSIHRT